MNNELKRALSGFTILALIGVIPAMVMEITYHTPPVLHLQSMSSQDIQLNIASEETQNSEIKNITVERMIISALPFVKPNITSNNKNWVCKPPRELEMGSGMVKECEWK